MTYFNGNVIRYKTKKFQRVLRSTSAAETIGLLQASRDVKGILLLLQELQLPATNICFRADNQACIKLVQTHKYGQGMKDLTLDQLLLRQEFRSGEFELKWVDTSSNVADIFTKNLADPAFSLLRAQLLVDRNSL